MLVDLADNLCVVTFPRGRDSVVLHLRSHRDPMLDRQIATMVGRHTGKELHQALIGVLPPDTSLVARAKLVKAIRATLVASQTKGSFEVQSRSIQEWANLQIAHRACGLSCVDSQRVARVGKSSQARRFNRERSCCGSSEWEAVGPDGNRYRLGFNYGH